MIKHMVEWLCVQYR